MSDPFDSALSEAASERAEQERRLAESQLERAREKAALLAKRMETFQELRSRIASKDEALEAMSFVRGESIDEARNFYRVVLSFDQKMIAAELNRVGAGYHMFVWWDHVRSDDGFIEPIDSANPETLDELMANLGSWVGRHGKPKEV